MENAMRNAYRNGLVGLGSVLALGLVGCSDGTSGPPKPTPEAEAIIFLQRAPRQANGNVFDYTSYEPGGRLVKLAPASADGTLTVLTPTTPEWASADIMAWDLSFDAKSIVFSAKLNESDRYHLYTVNVDGTNLKQLNDGPDDYVYPLFLPGQKVMFTTSKNVEEGAPQFQDEYERQETAQIGTMNIDGTGEELGPRNVSHRVAPALLPDGNVIYTEWRHLGEINDGHLRLMNTDMTRMREAFGGEEGGNGGTNSYLKARYVSSQTVDGKTTHSVVAVATSRDRTLQAGKLLLLTLGDSEANSKITDLTKLVPGGDTPSLNGVGRYYDAEVVGDPAAGVFLVSWANGPVESESLAAALAYADFGIYSYDSKTGVRRPIWDDRNVWDVMARPIKTRLEPPATASTVQGSDFVLSGISVYDTSLGNVQIPPGSAVKVRLLEGFSAEEGISMFGTTEFDGQSLYGEIPVESDGSFAARVPANVPVHMQVIDKFAVALADEPVWISGRAGEERTCGGCHEDRTKTPVVQPGQLQAVLKGPVNLVVPRAQRVSTNFTYGNVRGVPWDMAIQPMLNAKCVSCHDGDATKPGNKSYTVTDTTTGMTQVFTFDLRGDKLAVNVGEMMTADFSVSYISMFGLGELAGETVMVTAGELPCGSTSTRGGCALAANAKESPVITRLNPPQRFPSINLGSRFKAGMPIHPVDVGGQELTADEYYLLILNIDAGGQFFFRENKDGASMNGGI
jgi:hypothetical protein